MNGDVVDLRDWELRRNVERLIRVAGARVLAELLIEVGATRLCRTEIDRIVNRYIAAFAVREARQ